MGRWLRGGPLQEPQVFTMEKHDCYDHLPKINEKIECHEWNCRHTTHWALLAEERSIYRCDCGRIYKLCVPHGRDVADFPWEWKRSYFNFGLKENLDDLG